MRNAVFFDREILVWDRRDRFEAQGEATITDEYVRTTARANRASLQTVFVEIDQTEMFAVAAVLPANFNRTVAHSFKVKFTQEVPTILTFYGALARSEEASFVLGTEYSHICSSLQ